jgi:hypothetical protein
MPLVGDADDRAAARVQLLSALADAEDAWAVGELARTLRVLNPREQEWDQIQAVVRDALLQVNDGDHAAVDLAKTLLAFDPSEETQAEVYELLLKGLPTAHPLFIAERVDTILRLDSSERGRAEVRGRLLQALKTSQDARNIGELVDALLPLGLTDAEQAEVRRVLSLVTEEASGWALNDLVARLRAVTPLEDWLAWLAD